MFTSSCVSIPVHPDESTLVMGDGGDNNSLLAVNGAMNIIFWSSRGRDQRSLNTLKDSSTPPTPQAAHGDTNLDLLRLDVDVQVTLNTRRAFQNVEKWLDEIDDQSSPGSFSHPRSCHVRWMTA